MIGDVRHIDVARDDHGQRLSRWLKKNAPDMPFGLIQKLLRTGQIRVDGKRAKPDQKLEAGQSIRLPPVETRDKAESYRPGEKDAAMLRAAVLYDDGDILAIDKPAGLATQGGTGLARHLDAMLPVLASREGVVPRLVHRLDRETSGVLLLARSAEMARRLGALFAEKDMRKTYLALCAPAPRAVRGEIDAPLAKGKSGGNTEKMIADAEDGQAALTLYEVLAQSEVAAAVAFRPRTGRTHQIRVHAAYAGFPLAGDRKYGGATSLSDTQRIARVMLHAARLSFQHPLTGETLRIEAPVPADMQDALAACGLAAADIAGAFGGN